MHTGIFIGGGSGGDSDHSLLFLHFLFGLRKLSRRHTKR